MGSRLELHGELTKFLPMAYFQPPSNIKMAYPCIVYNKIPKASEYANNHTYKYLQGYQLTVITTDADSQVADNLESHFQYCKITREFVVDNLHHTTLNLYY